MIVEYVTKPFIIIDNLTSKFPPIGEVELKKRLVVCDINFGVYPKSQGDGLNFMVRYMVEHYLSNDEEKRTIVTTDVNNPKIESPYLRTAIVTSTAKAFRSLDGSEVVNPTTPEQLEALQNSETIYLNEYEWFCKMFNEVNVGPVREFIRQILLSEEVNGKTN